MPDLSQVGPSRSATSGPVAKLRISKELAVALINFAAELEKMSKSPDPWKDTENQVIFSVNINDASCNSVPEGVCRDFNAIVSYFHGLRKWDNSPQSFQLFATFMTTLLENAWRKGRAPGKAPKGGASKGDKSAKGREEEQSGSGTKTKSAASQLKTKKLKLGQQQLEPAIDILVKAIINASFDKKAEVVDAHGADTLLELVAGLGWVIFRHNKQWTKLVTIVRRLHIRQFALRDWKEVSVEVEKLWNDENAAFWILPPK